MRAFLCLTLISAMLPLAAQIQAEQKIILQNGQEIYGRIVAQDTGVSYTVSLAGQSTLIVPENRVESIQKSLPRYPSVRARRSSQLAPLQFDRQGIYAATHLGISFPRIYGENFAPNLGSNLSLYMRGGYRFSPLLGLGLSVGFQGVRGGTTVPLLLEANGGLIGRRRGPQYLMQAGWGAALVPRWWAVREFRGGPVAQAAIGWRRYFHGEMAMSYLLGYRYQMSREVEEMNNWWGGPAPNPVAGNLVTRHSAGFFLLVGVEW